MLAKERQNKIIDILYEKKIIKISEIVRMFDVSNETARRDLESVQDLRIAKRVYGGAVLYEKPSSKKEDVLQVGITGNWGKQHGRAERDAIGKKAAEFIREGNSVCLGSGTTVHEISKHLTHMKDLTVVTNSIAVLTELANTDISLHILGGQVEVNEGVMNGDITESAMRKFYVDKTFIGAGGVTIDGGITDYGQDSVLKNIMCDHANKVYLVANSEKFGVNAFAHICGLEKFDVIITDPKLPESYAERIRDMGIELVYADLPEEE